MNEHTVNTVWGIAIFFLVAMVVFMIFGYENKKLEYQYTCEKVELQEQ